MHATFLVSLGKESESARKEPTTSAPAAPTTESMPHRQILKAFTGLLSALLVAMLSSTIVSSALPTILADLDGTQGQYTWVITAMLLTSTATTPIWGKLSDLFSKKVLYQVAIVVFTVGCVLGGFAQSMPQLIAFRAVQGIGMGGLQALIQAVIAAMIAPRDRGRYAGYIGATFAVATVSGPLVGGLVVDSPLGWRWSFWVCVPIAVIAFVVLGRTLTLPVVKREVRIDWLGATLIVSGVALLLIWVTLAGTDFAWWSWETAALLTGSLASLGAAVAVESRVAEPVVPLTLFRNRTFTLAVVASVGVGTAMFGGAVFLVQYFQLARDFSPTAAGLLTLPMVLGMVGASTIVGRVVSRVGRTKPFLVAGSLVLLTGLCLLAGVDHDTNLWWMGVFLALMGIGVGSLMQNLVLAAQNTVGMADVGAATATVTFFRTLGGATGVSALGAVLGARVSDLVSEALAARGLPAAGGLGSGSGNLDVDALPGPVQDIVRAAYGDAMGTLFLITAGAAVVTVLAVAFVRETPLRDTLDLDDTATAPAPRRPAPAAHASTARATRTPSRPRHRPAWRGTTTLRHPLNRRGLRAPGRARR
ncbi:MFS transporter [Saccharomonospora piscinae]|uniref:MDR family MFS transporter n=1 Tax=Saccharomonospora piscinae TaxID=687388 RepID=UPI00110688D8|nr:MDR family MFS transporter [Saccharomonospora piscinae]TLW95324.1 MFS transporter [Saccharomonospora piscinae]